MIRRPCAGLALAATVALSLAGCATTPPEPRIVTKTVQVAVPVNCRPDLGADPAYPDSDAALKAAPDLYRRIALLVAGRLRRIAREGALKAALAACEGPGS